MAVAEPFVAPSPLRRGLAKRSPLQAVGRVAIGDRIGVLLLVVLVGLAVLAPVIAPYGPIAIAGLPFTAPFHGGHLLGTDEVGYDVFSRVLFGLRASIEGAVIVVASGVVIGGLVGLVAGVAGGWLDAVLMRITDLFLALPGPLLAIAFVAALGPSYSHTLLGVGIVWWPFYARIMRGEIRALKARPHLEAATLAGAGSARRALRHLLPGAVPAIVVTASLDVGNLVVTLASLSFLGLGDPAPAAELGAMSARGLQYLLQDWWVSVMPAIGIFLLALSSNLAGDAASSLLGGQAVTKILAKRLVSMVLVIVVLTAVVFLLQQLSHTSPVHAYLGANASPSAIAQETRVLGYDRPLYIQYVTYLGHLFEGNFGVSLRTRRPVGTDLSQFLPATLELMVAALVLALVLGATLGLAATGRWRGAGIFRVVLVSGASIPSFLLGLVLVLLLSDKVHWFPAIGDTGYTNAPTSPTGVMVIDTLVHGQIAMFWDALHHLVLPAVCVALGPAVSIGRVLRGSLEAAMGADFVRTARAKGLTERVVLFRHALRNSLSAALSMTGLQVGLMFAGVVVVETIFAWPGIGLYTDQSIPPADFPAIAGVTVVLGIGYVVINTVVDILQAVVDPRIVAE